MKTLEKIIRSLEPSTLVRRIESLQLKAIYMLPPVILVPVMSLSYPMPYQEYRVVGETLIKITRYISKTYINL